MRDNLPDCVTVSFHYNGKQQIGFLIRAEGNYIFVESGTSSFYCTTQEEVQTWMTAYGYEYDWKTFTQVWNDGIRGIYVRAR